MPVVELYAQARMIAGVRSVTVPGNTVQEVLAALAGLHPGLIGTVLDAAGHPTPAYAININGLRFCSDVSEPVDDTDEILLISSLSGG